jgi:hypothetical protein
LLRCCGSEIEQQLFGSWPSDQLETDRGAGLGESGWDAEAGGPLRLNAQASTTLMASLGPSCLCGAFGVVGVASRSTVRSSCCNRSSLWRRTVRAAAVRWRRADRRAASATLPGVAELYRGIDDLDTVGESLQRASGHGGDLLVSVGKPRVVDHVTMGRAGISAAE